MLELLRDVRYLLGERQAEWADSGDRAWTQRRRQRRSAEAGRPGVVRYATAAIDLRDYDRRDVDVTVADGRVVVHARRREGDEQSYEARETRRCLELPAGTDASQLELTHSRGVLSVEVPYASGREGGGGGRKRHEERKLPVLHPQEQPQPQLPTAADGAMAAARGGGGGGNEELTTAAVGPWRRQSDVGGGGGGYAVRVPVPGFDPAHIEVILVEGKVIVKAMIKDADGLRSLRNSYVLPAVLDAERMEAMYGGGELVLSVPEVRPTMADGSDAAAAGLSATWMEQQLQQPTRSPPPPPTAPGLSDFEPRSGEAAGAGAGATTGTDAAARTEQRASDVGQRSRASGGDADALWPDSLQRLRADRHFGAVGERAAAGSETRPGEPSGSDPFAAEPEPAAEAPSSGSVLWSVVSASRWPGDEGSAAAGRWPGEEQSTAAGRWPGEEPSAADDGGLGLSGEQKIAPEQIVPETEPRYGYECGLMRWPSAAGSEAARAAEPTAAAMAGFRAPSVAKPTEHAEPAKEISAPELAEFERASSSGSERGRISGTGHAAASDADASVGGGGGNESPLGPKCAGPAAGGDSYATDLADTGPASAFARAPSGDLGAHGGRGGLEVGGEGASSGPAGGLSSLVELTSPTGMAASGERPGDASPPIIKAAGDGRSRPATTPLPPPLPSLRADRPLQLPSGQSSASPAQVERPSAAGWPPPEQLSSAAGAANSPAASLTQSSEAVGLSPAAAQPLLEAAEHDVQQPPPPPPRDAEEAFRNAVRHVTFEELATRAAGRDAPATPDDAIERVGRVEHARDLPRPAESAPCGGGGAAHAASVYAPGSYVHDRPRPAEESERSAPSAGGGGGGANAGSVYTPGVYVTGAGARRGRAPLAMATLEKVASEEAEAEGRSAGEPERTGEWRRYEPGSFTAEGRRRGSGATPHNADERSAASADVKDADGERVEATATRPSSGDVPRPLAAAETWLQRRAAAFGGGGELKGA